MIVGVESNEGVDRHHVHVVTCHHVLVPPDPSPGADPWPAPAYDKIRLRLNRRGADADTVDVSPDDWVVHPTADVAAALLLPPPERRLFDYLHFPVTGTVDKDLRGRFKVGPGDDVFMTGLLHSHSGRAKIEPIIRVGTIAAFPEEKVTLEHCTTPQDVVLIEIRSIGGLSGSPVFFHLPDTPRIEDGGGTIANTAIPPASAGPNWLIGIMHGLWPTQPDDPDLRDKTAEPLNTGIAVVLPAERIVELLFGHTLTYRRYLVDDAIHERSKPTPTSVAPSVPTASGSAEPFTREMFLADLTVFAQPDADPDRHT
ncbi:MAG: hypothetical protein ACLPVY_11020 [Acidimicrobiia bacterium]